MKNYLLPTIFLVFICSFSVAQENTISSGGKAIGANGSSTYSVGEIVIPNNTGPGGSMSGGSQLPFEISLITSLPRIDMVLAASVFPNPTATSIQLKIGDPFLSSYTYALYNAQGVLLKSATIRDAITEIELSVQPKGIYLLTIRNKSRQVKSFKIVKVN